MAPFEVVTCRQGGWAIFNESHMAENLRRSSHRSMLFADEPNNGTLYASNSGASVFGIWPPTETMAPETCSLS